MYSIEKILTKYHFAAVCQKIFRYELNKISQNHILKMLWCFNSILGQIWTNPNVVLKCNLKM